MEITRINLFGTTFNIDEQFTERFQHLVEFIRVYSNCIWSCVYFNTGNELFYSILLIKVIDKLLEEFSVSHSEFIEPLPDCVVLDGHNLIGFITRLGDILSLVEMWFEERNYGELRNSLTDIYEVIQHISCILKFKYCDRFGGIQIHLEIFNDISFFISSPLEDVISLLPEAKMRGAFPHELVELKRNACGLIDLFSSF